MERVANKKDAADASIKEGETEVVRFSDVKSLGACFWMISLNCVFTYLGIFPYNNISNQFFREEYNFDQTGAGRLTSTVFLISAVFAPIFGILCDKIGH